METCVCGNWLRETPVTIRVSPCRCEAPGTGPTQLPSSDLPSWVSRKHFEERRKTGLPMLTPAEKTIGKRWS